MRTSDFYYELPRELIAQCPLESRTDSRLLCMNRDSGAMEHRRFGDILDYLNAGDCLVLNDTRVIPARLCCETAEILLLSRKEGAVSDTPSARQGDVWEVIGRKLKVGSRHIFGDELEAEVLEALPCGNRLVKFTYNGIFEEVLDRLGEMPLPPYITEKLADKERYQTVYSRNEGSAAAPTAGLHFTQELLDEIERKGVDIVYLTLHVGLGTFRPVKVDDPQGHKMHAEYYELSEEAAVRIKAAKSVVCVGTTTMRVLESVARDVEQRHKIDRITPNRTEDSTNVLYQEGFLRSGRFGGAAKLSGWTDIFIYPPYDFKVVDKLITNFHLPESTLLMLVSAFSSRENILNAYSEAIKEEYRFFSFGDAMLLF